MNKHFAAMKLALEQRKKGKGKKSPTDPRGDDSPEMNNAADALKKKQQGKTKSKKNGKKVSGAVYWPSSKK